MQNVFCAFLMQENDVIKTAKITMYAPFWCKPFIGTSILLMKVVLWIQIGYGWIDDTRAAGEKELSLFLPICNGSGSSVSFPSIF